MRKLVIDQDLLKRLGACLDGRDDFARDYPDGLILTDDQEVNRQILMDAPDSAYEECWPRFGTLRPHRLGWLAGVLVDRLPPGLYDTFHSSLGAYAQFDANRWSPEMYAVQFAFIIHNLKRHP